MLSITVHHQGLAATPRTTAARSSFCLPKTSWSIRRHAVSPPTYGVEDRAPFSQPGSRPRLSPARFQLDSQPQAERNQKSTVVRTRNILIALDNTPESDVAVDWAVTNLLRTGDHVHLFHLYQGATSDHVFSTPSGHLVRINNGMADAMERQAKASGANKAHELYTKYSPLLAHQEVTLHAHVAPMPHPVTKTSVGQALCDQALSLDAALVVIASHSHGGLSELMRGSVANWAVKHCDSPVAILHDPIKKRKAREAAAAATPITAPPSASTPAKRDQQQARQLVVAVDASDASVRACQWILDHMYRTGDRVHLVHVVPSIPLNAHMSDFLVMPGFESDVDVQEKQRQLAEQEAQQWQEHHAQRFREILDKAGVDFTFDTTVLPTEDPVSAISGFICSKAEELDAAAVILSHHEHSPLMEFFLGSVSNQVAHHCARPVVVLHGNSASE